MVPAAERWTTVQVTRNAQEKNSIFWIITIAISAANAHSIPPYQTSGTSYLDRLEIRIEESGGTKSSWRTTRGYSASLGALRRKMTDRKAVIKNADMSEEMQQDAVDCATQALEKFNIEKDIAAYIKKEFDKKYNPTWHCIVGRNFGSYVTHETRHFIYFYLGQVAILLFKSG
ncbi:unnamed protein product [Nesidiocoris tenuis]|uniref:Dynein light chain n=3 Tax=Miridae TaxID=30083 RepID=A0A6H5GG02_9HEMI|nr:unnamed protein product [Nesidiocoris tenuis]